MLGTHPDAVVQIDETLMFRRKNNVGHVVGTHWVFGACDNHLKKGFMRRVPDRSAATLIPLIQQWIAPGATIHSDCWAAYSSLSQLGYVHRTVNHTNHTSNFVDPRTGATTNNVEALWSRVKRSLKYVCGSQGDLRWSRFDEAIYRDYYDIHSTNVWENWETFLTHMSETFPL